MLENCLSLLPTQIFLSSVGSLLASKNNHIRRRALEVVASRGMPAHMSLDHDLGGDDTSMIFLRRLTNDVWDDASPPPDYQVHSANPVGGGAEHRQVHGELEEEPHISRAV